LAGASHRLVSVLLNDRDSKPETSAAEQPQNFHLTASNQRFRINGAAQQ
jgi:hypothetical protein